MVLFPVLQLELCHKIQHVVQQTLSPNPRTWHIVDLTSQILPVHVYFIKEDNNDEKEGDTLYDNKPKYALSSVYSTLLSAEHKSYYLYITSILRNVHYYAHVVQ